MLGPTSPGLLPLLSSLNLSLQAFDGISTYYGLALGVQERNPLVQTLIEQLEAGWGLLIVKWLACGLLLFLRAYNQYVLCVHGLLLTVASYFVFSFLPWVFLFFSL